MYNQQAYPPFALNHGLMQDGLGGYARHPQAYYFPAMKQGAMDFGVQGLGEHTAQVMSWNNPSHLEPHTHLPHRGSPHHVRGESPSICDRETIKEESSDSGGRSEEDCPSAPPGAIYYPQCWSNDWSVNPIPKSISVKESNGYADAPSQSPNTPGETAAYNLESSRCNSAPTATAATKGDAAATSPKSSEETASCDGEEAPEVPTQEELEEFAKEMKRRRVSMGFTQADVGYALGVLYGQMFSQTTICRFESLQLSFKNMCQLKPLLHRWLDEAENNDNLQELINRQQTFIQSSKRKRRTSIENVAKDSLEIYFMKNAKPGTHELAEIARELNMEKDVVRVWFCNRRQKGKRHVTDKEYKGYAMQHQMHPHVGVFPMPHEMAPQGYMSAPLPSAQLYPPAFNHKNMFSPLHN